MSPSLPKIISSPGRPIKLGNRRPTTQSPSPSPSPAKRIRHVPSYKGLSVIMDYAQAPYDEDYVRPPMPPIPTICQLKMKKLTVDDVTDEQANEWYEELCKRGQAEDARRMELYGPRRLPELSVRDTKPLPEIPAPTCQWMPPQPIPPCYSATPCGYHQYPPAPIGYEPPVPYAMRPVIVCDKSFPTPAAMLVHVQEEHIFPVGHGGEICQWAGCRYNHPIVQKRLDIQTLCAHVKELHVRKLNFPRGQ